MAVGVEERAAVDVATVFTVQLLSASDNAGDHMARPLEKNELILLYCRLNGKEKKNADGIICFFIFIFISFMIKFTKPPALPLQTKANKGNRALRRSNLSQLGLTLALTY